MTDPDETKPSTSRMLKTLVRVSSAEYKAFERAATRTGLTVATWLRLVGRTASGLSGLGLNGGANEDGLISVSDDVLYDD